MNNERMIVLCIIMNSLSYMSNLVEKSRWFSTK